MRASDEIIIVEPSNEYENSAINCVIEMVNQGSTIDGVSGFLESNSFESWLKELDRRKGIVYEDFEQAEVPSQLFLGVREIDKKVIGFIELSMKLNRTLSEAGTGHIAYSVMPSERNKGYAKAMLQKVIKVAKKHGMKKLQIGCFEANVSASKVIEANGGILVGKDNRLIPHIQYEIVIK